jgi:hypothetical protein
MTMMLDDVLNEAFSPRWRVCSVWVARSVGWSVWSCFMATHWRFVAVLGRFPVNEPVNSLLLF